MTHAAEHHENALETFQEALTARERIGDGETIQVAKWMVAWSLRNLGRHGESVTMHHELKAELDSDEAGPPLEEENTGRPRGQAR
jgi:hypothetical protein